MATNTVTPEKENKNTKEPEIQVDELIENTPEPTPTGQEFINTSWAKYQRLISAALVILMLLFAGLWYYFNSIVPEQEEEAQEQLFSAIQYFEQDSFDKALNVDTKYQHTGLKAFVDEYGSRDAGKLAKLYLGLAYLQKKQFDEAIEVLDGLNFGNNIISAAAFSGLANAYEEKQEFKSAANAYRKAAGMNENNSTTPFFLMSAARNYEYANDKESALQTYKQIKQLYPLSEEGQKIDKYIARIEANKPN